MKHDENKLFTWAFGQVEHLPGSQEARFDLLHLPVTSR